MLSQPDRHNIGYFIGYFATKSCQLIIDWPKLDRLFPCGYPQGLGHLAFLNVCHVTL